jgi:putative RNA 2'-phosphotransferase
MSRLSASQKSRSKFLSLVLRHQPSKIGLVLDDAGWVDVDVLLAACAAHGTPLTRDELAAIIADNDKQRFALSDDGRRIRASQGHTVDVDLGYTPSTPPETLFHGTVAAALDAIRKTGLQKMQRHAVHLSPDATTATAVGGRRGKPIILRVRAAAMHADGFAFQVSANGVWLTDHVPPQYIEFPSTPGVAGGSDFRPTGGGKRKAIARDSLAACDAGGYTAPSGTKVDLRASIDAAVADTRVYDLSFRAAVTARTTTTIAVVEETTLEGLIRLQAPNLGCLNFASARNPGGGFLGGAQAQEESLARASALYPCLVTCFESHYVPNREQSSLLYLDLAIFSPDVPFFRDDTGAWLEQPILASVITCAAPNAGALANQRSPDLDRVPTVLRRRADLVLRIAAHHDLRTLVLGAWGAGIFGNDPTVVASAFASLLSAEYRNVFSHVVFSIHDTKPNQPVLAAFRSRFET